MKTTRSGILEVAANFALSWDARISDHAGAPSTFSSPRDKARLLEIRATGDAVLVGRRTVETDQMEMGLPDETLRAARLARGQSEYPLRVIVSASGALSPDLKVFQRSFSPVVLFTTSAISAVDRAALEGKADIQLSSGDTVSPREMLQILAEQYGVRRLICEGGAGLFRTLLEADLVDEINVTFCPVIFGGANAPTLTGAVSTNPAFLPKSRECQLEEMEVIEGECFARYRVIG